MNSINTAKARSVFRQKATNKVKYVEYGNDYPDRDIDEPEPEEQPLAS